MSLPQSAAALLDWADTPAALEQVTSAEGLAALRVHPLLNQAVLAAIGANRPKALACLLKAADPERLGSLTWSTARTGPSFDVYPVLGSWYKKGHQGVVDEAAMAIVDDNTPVLEALLPYLTSGKHRNQLLRQAAQQDRSEMVAVLLRKTNPQAVFNQLLKGRKWNALDHLASSGTAALQDHAVAVANALFPDEPDAAARLVPRTRARVSHRVLAAAAGDTVANPEALRRPRL